MASPIVPVASWDTVIPTPDDGEVATGPGLDGMAQPLANRGEYLKKVVDVDGVRFIRTAASIGALPSSAENGELRYVLGRGIYRASVPDGSAANSPWIIVSGSVRWYHELALVQGGDLATLSSGRVVQLPPMQPIASNATQLSGAYGANVFFSSAATWTDASGCSTSLTNVPVGDLLFGTLSCRAILGAASATSIGTAVYPKLALAYEHNGVTTRLAEVELQALGTGEVAPVINWRHRYAVTSSFSAATPHIFKVQVLSDGTQQARILYPSFAISIEQVRP